MPVQKQKQLKSFNTLFIFLMFENVTEMDLTPAGTISQLQNTTFLTNVFMTTFLASLGLEGIKTLIGEIYKHYYSFRPSIFNK